MIMTTTETDVTMNMHAGIMGIIKDVGIHVAKLHIGMIYKSIVTNITGIDINGVTPVQISQLGGTVESKFRAIEPENEFIKLKYSIAFISLNYNPDNSFYYL
jgi:hypothetical protein